MNSPTNLAAFRLSRARVQIGSQYHGPAFDRPALRQMPAHWTLEESRPHQGDKWLAIIAGLIWVLAIVQTCLELAAR